VSYQPIIKAAILCHARQDFEKPYFVKQDKNGSDDMSQKDLLTPLLSLTQKTPRQHHPLAARILAQAAAWAYADLATQASRMLEVGFNATDAYHFEVENSALFLNTHVSWLCDEKAKVGILSFRGTEFGTGHYVDLLTDIAIDPVNYKDDVQLKVHGGFYYNQQAVWPNINSYLQDRLANIERIYITGHSLGGALAVLAAAEIFWGNDAQSLQLQSLYAGLYTFGQPMVGTGLFAARCEKMFGDTTYRHVHRKDLVPQLPPRTTGSFKHFGHEYRVDTEGRWCLSSQKSGQVNTISISAGIAGLAFLARQFTIMRHMPFMVSLADHGPLYYLAVSEQSAVGFL
jgi:hypothetical protein